MILGKFTNLVQCGFNINSIFWNQIQFCKAKNIKQRWKLKNREGTKGDEKHVATSLLLNVS